MQCCETSTKQVSLLSHTYHNKTCNMSGSTDTVKPCNLKPFHYRNITMRLIYSLQLVRASVMNQQFQRIHKNVKVLWSYKPSWLGNNLFPTGNVLFPDLHLNKKQM